MNKLIISTAPLLVMSAAYADLPPTVELRTFDVAQVPDEPPPPPIPPKVPRGIPTDPAAPPSADVPPMLAQGCAATTDLLNLRTGPGDEYPIITALPPGTIVSVLEDSTDRWQHVATTAGGGWVFKAYIHSAQCPPPPPLVQGCRPPSRSPCPFP
jgi:uncharacterized protein YgiM (DUF1202 family)